MSKGKFIACYCRVSSKKQKHASQEPDLKRYAAERKLPCRFFYDTFTGKSQQRPGWLKLEADMRAGKVAKLVCWKIDRLGRTARELLGLFDELRQRKIELVVVAGGIMGLDTPEGRLMAGIIAQFAEFDNEQRSERILAGQAAARESGKTWGGSMPGKRKKVTPVMTRTIKRMRLAGESVAAISRTVHCTRETTYSVLVELGLHKKKDATV